MFILTSLYIGSESSKIHLQRPNARLPVYSPTPDFSHNFKDQLSQKLNIVKTLKIRGTYYLNS